MSDNRDMNELRTAADRIYNIEKRYREATAERKEERKDLKAELNSRKDTTGFNFAEADRIAQAMLDLDAFKEKHNIDDDTLADINTIYGDELEPDVDDDEV